ncbi:hypothetical protein NX779_02365 [Mycoplasma cottewii]|uniref:Uncharacterized protein n=1 Tax=Mycoplasma cottewii TaxID=51364 RepID=A0ABY5TVE6_9MOLU|nr:hypothetical protein [Mycoplasma cottewii]UWD34639.1 hypothetical protein NX779_02365 [Mycoplasma cottewii]
MIEIYKLKDLNSYDLQAYSHINPWFKNRLNKLILKNKKLILNFNLNPNDYITFDDISQVKLDKVFKDVNNYLNFFKPKIKQIITEKQLFKKFSNSIRNYMMLVGMCHAINTMIDFYKKLDKETILNKQQTVYLIGNEVLDKKFERYTIEVLKLIPDEYKNNLKDLYSEKIEIHNSFFNSKQFVKWTAKYASRLFKNEKINQKDYLKILYLCYLENDFNRSYISLLQEFVNKLV